MPSESARDGVSLHYEVSGDGDTVVFVGDAGLGAWQWGWQHGHIAGPYRAITWDLRGTGQSDSPLGQYDVETLASDLECILSATETSKCHVVGAGLGGMVALQYVRAFSRARTMTLLNTAPSGTHVDEAALRQLCGPDTESTTSRDSLLPGLSESFRTENPGLVETIREWRRDDDAGPEGFDGQVGAMMSFDAGPLYEITTPTLVCHGVDDPVVPVSAGEELAEGLPRGVFEAVEGRHLCHIEHSRPVSDRMLAFIDEHAE